MSSADSAEGHPLGCECGDDALVDGGGYPTDCGIARVRGFRGAPAELVDLLQRLWWTPSLVTIGEALGGSGAPVVRVSLVTAGWSGNEQVIGALDGTMFRLRFWESSHRGGLHVYEVPQEQWTVAGQLGVIGAGSAGR